MIADKIKYIADQVIGLVSNGASAGKNYKQLPLPLAVLVCAIAIVVLGLLCSTGIMIIFNSLK